MRKRRTELPADPEIRIIALDSVGGYTPPRRNKEPELVIYANGRAVITDPFGKHPQVIRHLTQENVKAWEDGSPILDSGAAPNPGAAPNARGA